MKCPSCGIENLDDSRFCRQCTRPLPEGTASFTRTAIKEPTELAFGTIIAGHYRIDKIIGRGGMGIVYLADDTRLKRPVALKFLPPGLAMNEDVRKRFIIEAQAAAALSHPNICTIYEVDDQAEKAFISMEYVEGEDLRQRSSKRPLPFDGVLDIALQVCAGLDDAHKKGIVHRDIKSGNIMLTAKGQAKIMDFGLAKVAGSAMVTEEGLTMGTVAYMSPEQAKGEGVDARTDIWSLGVVLYELASGKMPFRGDLESAIIHNIIHEEPKPLKAIVPRVPEEFERIIRRALKKKVNDRYGSAAEMLADLKKLRMDLEKEKAGVFNIRSFLRNIRKPHVAIPSALVLIGLGFLISSGINKQMKVRWARQVALPQVEKFIQANDFTAAYKLAREAERYIPKDPDLSEALPPITGSISLVTDPAGAQFLIKDYGAPDGAFELVGVTPLDKTPLPIGYKRWKIVKEGYETVEGAGWIYATPDLKGSAMEIKTKLDAKGSLPSDMVRIQPSYEFVPRLGSMGNLPPLKLADFLLDKYEVTNRQYKRFMDDGGYQRPEFWKKKFIRDGKEIRWEEATNFFVDRTGRPGPATWELGTYSEGQENCPVGGVSWYEAAAYAEYAGKSLPTIYHWRWAVGDHHVQGMLDAAFLIPLSNFNGKGPTPVGRMQGLSSEGVYDMAGNVKEWILNETADGKRGNVGGGWDEPNYMLGSLDRYSAWFRSPNFGFRCMKDLAESPMAAVTAQTIPLKPPPSLGNLKPCSDGVFRIYAKFYEYVRSPLNPKVEQKEDLTRHAVFEKVTFDAAYGGERTGAYLFIPKEGKGPFQTVIHWPGSSAIQLKTISEYGANEWPDFHTTSGRAWVVPILSGTFGRQWTSEFVSKTTNFERTVMMVKDFMRTVDYLETRPEFDTRKLAYEGLSWGASAGGLVPAIEKRIGAVVLLGPILDPVTEPEETHQITYAPRITVPVLIQTGRYDFLASGENVTRELLGIFGAPAKDKYLKVYESGHSVWLLMEQKRDELNFLDKYFGPVKK